jgi:hypothetical protein
MLPKGTTTSDAKNINEPPAQMRSKEERVYVDAPALCSDIIIIMTTHTE